MPALPKIPPRGRHVTSEPLVVATHLLGAPLASFRRRAWAYAVDLVVFGAVVGSLFMALSLLSIHRDDPTFLPRLQAFVAQGGGDEEDNDRIGLDLLKLVVKRAPGALPMDLVDAVDAGDLETISERWLSQDLVVGFGSGRTTLTRQDDKLVMKLGTDVMLGDYSSFFSWGAVFVGWFTLWARLTRGRSPGKWLAGVRVVRLDGRPLGWWASFSRAGGYSASAATLLLGFLEMIWDPNRQTLHDRIAATVVLRGRRSPASPAPADP